jgi:hypothetical protein
MSAPIPLIEINERLQTSVIQCRRIQTLRW